MRGPMDLGGATLAAAAMRAGLIDEYAIVTHPVLVGGGTPFFTALDNWVNLNLAFLLLREAVSSCCFLGGATQRAGAASV